jgi:hypothetical protein
VPCARERVRPQRRNGGAAEFPEFAKYLAATEGLVVAQEDRIMRPVEFKTFA